MRDPTDATLEPSRREPWNNCKLVGAKPPLRPKHVWSIRTKLQIAGRTRDSAMFNLAIDSKLRGCDDVGRLRVEDVVPHGHAVDRATVHHKLTIISMGAAGECAQDRWYVLQIPQFEQHRRNDR
jgi:hypothetical protein